MPLAAYAATRLGCTQAGKSAHWASRAGKWRTAVRISPLKSRAAKASRTSWTRVIAVDVTALRTASNSDITSPLERPQVRRPEFRLVRLLFAHGSTGRFAAQ